MKPLSELPFVLRLVVLIAIIGIIRFLISLFSEIAPTAFGWVGRLIDSPLWMFVALVVYVAVVVGVPKVWRRLHITREEAHEGPIEPLYVYRKEDGSVSDPQTLRKLVAQYRMRLLHGDTPVAPAGTPEHWQTLTTLVADYADREAQSET